MCSRPIATFCTAVLFLLPAQRWSTASNADVLDGQQTAAPARDPRPADPRAASARELELIKTIADQPTRLMAYIEAARLQEDRGAVAQAETTLLQGRQALPRSGDVLLALAAFYQRVNRFEDAVSALQDYASLDPSSPQRQQIIATYYWEKAFKDQDLPPMQKVAYIQSGIAATDRALAMDPDYAEALTYKNILLRMQANLETDRATQQKLLAEADQLRTHAIELQRQRGTAATPQNAGSSIGSRLGPPPPPPPPPEAVAPSPVEPVDGMMPLRVGGNIKPPTKVKDVRPVYPMEAQAAKVTGLVIIEAAIDGTGHVRNARVLRSIPLLDEAAIDAVKQWEFMPTLLNGQPVPIIMTVTVNFSLQ